MREAKMSTEKEANKHAQKGKVRRKRIEIADELIDRLLKEYGLTQEGIFGAEGAIKELTGRLVERALAGELTHHLGYAKGELPEGEARGNCRNGSTRKELGTESGPV